MVIHRCADDNRPAPEFLGQGWRCSCSAVYRAEWGPRRGLLRRRVLRWRRWHWS